MLDEINLASPQILELLEVFMSNMCPSDLFSSKWEEIFPGPIIIVARMNSAGLLNVRSAISTKLQTSSHFPHLIPFNKYEL
jgi:hypothetical protein